jgi:DNA-binding GntR family transcriptional regulator
VSSTPPAGSAGRVAELLRDEIVEGRLTSGSPLREPVLCERLGVSRNTLREGLRLLDTAGLVEFGLYRGASVKELGPGDIGDIYIVRRTLELRAVEHGLVDQEGLHAMAQLIALAEQRAVQGDWPAVSTAGLRFHQRLVAVLGSRQLDQLFGNVVAQLRLLFSQAPQMDTFESPWIPRDREIHDLISRGRRAEAVRALAVYLDDSERAVMDILRVRRFEQEQAQAPRRRRSSSRA